MLYRVLVVDSNTGAEAVVFLDTPTPADATAWLHAHGFAVGDIRTAAAPDLDPTPARPPTTPPSPTETAIVIAAEKISRSGLVRSPVWTIAWAIVLAGIIWIVLFFVVTLLLGMLGVATSRLF